MIRSTNYWRCNFSTIFNNLSLFLDKITDDLLISISPKSSENNSQSIGSPTQLIIKANLEKIIVKVPLLQVSGTIQGQEDIPFPVLTNLGGSISVSYTHLTLPTT